jgi:hypothetical protein
MAPVRAGWQAAASTRDISPQWRGSEPAATSGRQCAWPSDVAPCAPGRARLHPLGHAIDPPPTRTQPHARHRSTAAPRWCAWHSPTCGARLEGVLRTPLRSAAHCSEAMQTTWELPCHRGPSRTVSRAPAPTKGSDSSTGHWDCPGGTLTSHSTWLPTHRSPAPANASHPITVSGAPSDCVSARPPLPLPLPLPPLPMSPLPMPWLVRLPCVAPLDE